MNLIELNRALRQLRLGGIAAVLETRLHQAQAEAMPPIDFLSCLVSDELTRRGERLLERRKNSALDTIRPLIFARGVPKLSPSPRPSSSELLPEYGGALAACGGFVETSVTSGPPGQYPRCAAAYSSL